MLDISDFGSETSFFKVIISKEGTPGDRIVNTTNGIFRETELTVIEKAKKPSIESKEVVDFETVMSVDIREYYDRMKKKLLREYKLKQLGL